MLDFMVVGLPRSGTAWLANWFTTERSMCWHEPLWQFELEALDVLPHSGLFGIADTQIVLMDVDEINRHPAKKLIVHRDLLEVNESLGKLGLPPMRDEHKWKLDEIGGHHLQYRDMFRADEFRRAHEWLVPTAFDPARFQVLREMNIQNQMAIYSAQEVYRELGFE